MIHPFVADFVCLNKKLIVEIDGGQHDENQQYDEKRSALLKLKGYKVLRFWNSDVLKATEAVLSEILRALESCV